MLTFVLKKEENYFWAQCVEIEDIVATSTDISDLMYLLSYRCHRHIGKFKGTYKELQLKKTIDCLDEVQDKLLELCNDLSLLFYRVEVRSIQFELVMPEE